MLTLQDFNKCSGNVNSKKYSIIGDNLIVDIDLDSSWIFDVKILTLDKKEIYLDYIKDYLEHVGDQMSELNFDVMNHIHLYKNGGKYSLNEVEKQLRSLIKYDKDVFLPDYSQLDILIDKISRSLSTDKNLEDLLDELDGNFCDCF